MRAEPYLSLDSLSKSYDGRQSVVQKISLSVERGEFVSLLGPSGSGKTTTLMMIAGFELPTSGSIRLGGRSLENTPPNQRNIGIVFQNYALFPHMTILRNVAFPLRVRGVAAAERDARARKALDMVGLEHLSNRRPRELSGGQQQRVALARALVFEPDILLLDEPLGALDKNLREQMQIEIKRLHRQLGITTIYVTHDQSEAMTLSDRMVIFSNGEIAQAGTPLDVYHRPRSSFVAKFVGDCNMLKGHVVDSASGVVRVEGFGTICTQRATDENRGKSIDLIVRPEFVRLGSNAVSDDITFEMQVESVMNYGESAVVFGVADGRPFRARAMGHDIVGLSPGEKVRASIRPTDLWILPESGTVSAA